MDLKDLSGAQRVYLGQDFNTRETSCKLSLLFDQLSDPSETPYMEQIGVRLAARLLQLRQPQNDPLD